MLAIAAISTKGGPGKTTTMANLGAFLADLGYRVLLVDADIQPALTRYFRLSYEAPSGLTEMVMRGALLDGCISHVELPPAGFKGDDSVLNKRGGILHLVRSDTQRLMPDGTFQYDGALQEWLANRLDRLVRIRMAIRSERIQERYDIILIDTQGAVGHLQDAAVNASDMLVIPTRPDILNAREFTTGTLALMDRHESSANMGFAVPAMKAFINQDKKTVDSRAWSKNIRDQFLTLRGRVHMLQATLPDATAFARAATAQVPVHWIDPVRAGDVMHRFAWELIPSLEGTFAPNHRGELEGWPSRAALASGASPEVESDLEAA